LKGIPGREAREGAGTGSYGKGLNSLGKEGGDIGNIGTPACFFIVVE